MYYNDYEDYMRNILGYPNTNDNTYQGNYNSYNNMDYNMNYNSMNYSNQIHDNMMCGCMQSNPYQNRDNFAQTRYIEDMYPEIYKIINPMVCEKCDRNTEPVTEYLIDQMTNEIYDNVVNRMEVQNVININVETRENNESENRVEDKKTENTNRSGTSITSNSMRMSLSNSDKVSNSTCNKEKESKDETRETRSPSVQSQSQRRNGLLRDLIRILIINRILSPNRPPFRPNRPNRPPYRPGAGMGPRLPMQRMSNQSVPYM